ncbi:hypothetical protein MMC12_002319 [Toensbergia leucococca]|nr:hypothetical protein [Toensbergia leucococca]
MPSQPKRPKNKGGSEPLNATAKGFEQSNSTMTKFLGGKQKDWMIELANANMKELAPRSTFKRSGLKPSGTGENYVPPQNVPSLEPVVPCDTIASMNQSQRKTPPETLSNVSLSSMANVTNHRVQGYPVDTNTVLPSPAPSDEPNQEIALIIDLEKDEEQQEHLAEEPDHRRLTELAERYGGIEELEKRLQSVEKSQDTSEEASAKQQGEMFMGSAQVESRKRMLGHELPSSKRLQNTPMPLPAIQDRLSQRPTVITSNTVNIIPELTHSSFEMQDEFSRAITDRLRDLEDGDAARGTVERPRLKLLQDACMTSDYFYLLLHQIYCLNTHQPTIFDQLQHFGPEQAAGLEVISRLILLNKHMTPEAISWFSTFPRPIHTLLHTRPNFQSAFKRVHFCLAVLAKDWEQLQAKCHKRCFPPLVDELHIMIGADSPILQRVICTAIYRDYWIGEQDQCYHDGFQIFLRNQKVAQERLSQNHAYQVPDEAHSYNVSLVTEYRRLWRHHNEHLRRQAPTMMPECTIRAPSDLSPMPPPSLIQARVSTLSTVNALGRVAQQDAARNALSPTSSGQGSTLRNNIHSAQQSFPSTLWSTHTMPSSTTQDAERNPVAQMLASLEEQSPQSPHNYMREISSTPSHSVMYVAPPGHVPSQPQRRVSSTSDSLRPSSLSRSFRSYSENVTQSIESESLPAVFQSSIGQRHYEPGPARTFAPRNRHAGASQHSPTGLTGFQAQVAGVNNSAAIPFNPVSLGSLVAGHHQAGNVYHQSQCDTSQQAPGQRTQRLLPPPGYIQPASISPRPLTSALHQAHVRSPILQMIDITDERDDKNEYFRYFKSLAAGPIQLSLEKCYHRGVFLATNKFIESLATDLITSLGSPPTRAMRMGSCSCRLRCVNMTAIGDDPTESQWAVAENTWPANIAIQLNDTVLEIRRKIHHGKDLPVDVTPYIKEGDNTLMVSIIRYAGDEKVIYSLGLEAVEITNTKKIKDDIARLDCSEAWKRIMKHSGNLDPDVQVLDSSVAVDLTDPYTSRIFNTPARGKTCRHSQCFDLDIFLQTRKENKSRDPCRPERFKCPICGADARPQYLEIDGFLMKVRHELEEAGRLDARVIVLTEHGDWQIRETEEVGEAGDGSGRSMSWVKDLGNHTSACPKQFPTRKESTIIDLDD